MYVYLNPIANGIMISLLLLYALFIPLTIYQYRKDGRLQFRKNIVIGSFVLYMITAWFMTIFPLPDIEQVRQMKPMQANFCPFLFVKTFLNHSGFVLSQPSTWLKSLSTKSFYTVAFNFVLTMPFGVYLKKYFKCSIFKTIMFGFLLSFFYEMTQYTGLYGIYPKAYRFPDVDDLIVNTLGAAGGFYLTNRIERFLPNMDRDKNNLVYKNVGLFQRIIAFLLDTLLAQMLYTISCPIINIMLGIPSSWNIILLVLFDCIIFLFIPLIFQGSTLGMVILKVRVDSEGERPITLGQIWGRNGLVLLIFRLLPDLSVNYNNSTMLQFGSQILVLLSLGCLFIGIIRKQKNLIFYEHWTKTTLKKLSS
ncbi:VanZ family protein [Anaerosacchariphilus polymeriproducens]|uniref:VanZ family protein n=1 Tax=Anaerosacchariphilus polymeriproducens TaxID=1812858 RepID=A0A371AYH0_9FIRM|nr:VanZ family protein [Anaerosacchariphilus polymeriproducens]RDU24638.1 VanZ family protein [Anaerosacchariphilus polymeriproducens]